MNYTTIKITAEQKKVIDKFRKHRPDLGERVYERTVSLVVSELIEKAQKYDDLVSAK